MKRDMDAIRQIMLAVRDADGPVNSIDAIDKQSFCFHAQLLAEAGLVIGKINTDNSGMPRAAVLYRLTWDGHDFADSVADETVWNKAKKHLLGPSVSWSFTILRELVTAIIKDRLKI